MGPGLIRRPGSTHGRAQVIADPVMDRIDSDWRAGQCQTIPGLLPLVSALRDRPHYIGRIHAEAPADHQEIDHVEPSLAQLVLRHE